MFRHYIATQLRSDFVTIASLFILIESVKEHAPIFISYAEIQQGTAVAAITKMYPYDIFHAQIL